MKPSEAVAALNAEPPRQQQFIPTGSLGLDLALGGGYPVGGLTEITGDTATGKTALALLAVAQMQKLGMVVLADSWGEFRPERAERLGVDTGNLPVLSAVPAHLGPIRFLVTDSLPDGAKVRELHSLGRGDAQPLTVVATSMRYRNFSGRHPWVHLTWLPQGRVLAAVQTDTAPGLRTATLYPYAGGLDTGRELLQLGTDAGVIRKEGGRYYLRRSKNFPALDIYLGNGAQAAAKAASEVEWLPAAITRILTRADSAR